MMKKIKKWFKRWWFKHVTYPGMMAMKTETMHSLRDAIILQMWHGGLSYANMNKWLRTMNMAPIVGYVFTAHAKAPLVFYGEITEEQRLKYPNIKKVYE